MNVLPKQFVMVGNQKNMSKCIKCKKEYIDSDPDDYYCPECLIIKKKFAEELQKKIDARPKKPVKSDLQRYDELRGKSPFINAKYL